MLRGHKLSFVQLALPAGDPALGEKGLATLPDRRDDFDASMEIGFAYAERIGCRMVHMMAGIPPPELPIAEAENVYLERLTRCAAAAADRGLTLVVEPISAGTIEGYFLRDPIQAADLLRRVKSTDVKIIFDVFHASYCGVDPVDFINRHSDLIAHVHVADFPGRHEPGSGTIDFLAVFAALKKIGYRGAIGCEYLPSTPDRKGTLVGLQWAQTLLANI